MEIETRPLVAGDLGRAAEVLGLAFHDYPWTRWVVDARDHVARITELQLLGLARFGLPYGSVWVTTVDGVVQSVASWFDSAVTVPAGVIDACGPRVAELEGDRCAASQAAEAESHGWRPTDRHLYLATMGTVPQHQGSGLGTRTLLPGIELADREGMVACLETSSIANVEFYSGLGFRIVRYWRIAEGSGPDLWLMQRSPGRPAG
ncbi:MAG: GNAT family N-acetyltransferase [Ilumatobacteraceae bacterium]